MSSINITENLLPYDGETYYHGLVLHPAKAHLYFEKMLEEISWRHDEVKMFGKHIVTKRKVAWYGNLDLAYTYSGITRKALPWTQHLEELKNIVERTTGHNFNSCLLNLYHNGEEGMSWHADDEAALGNEPVIASLSLGAARQFFFKHKQTKETTGLVLENGSILLMKGATQKNWLHSLPKTKKIMAPRINLTFRTIIAKDR